MSDAAMLDQTRAACRTALEYAADLAPLWKACRTSQHTLQGSRDLLPSVQTYSNAIPRLAALKETLAREGYPVANGAFERFLIVSAAHESIDRLAALSVDERVRDLFCQNFLMYAATPAKLPEPFDLARTSFVAMARIATLTRFPAGQLDWEVSGIPRSWLLKVPFRALPRLVSSIFELRGFQPAFFSHINPNRRNQAVLLERESLRSYHRIARSMERQPAIKGLITASWLHSPDTFAVSPHLAWMNKLFVENGGHVLPLGPADIGTGVLHRSPERQKAYEAGTFTPTEGLVIWPRAAMLAWARGHQELRDDRARPARAMGMREARA